MGFLSRVFVEGEVRLGRDVGPKMGNVLKIGIDLDYVVFKLDLHCLYLT